LQPDLFSDRALELTPAPRRAEPLLWVRQLIIWEEPGKEIRNIPLRQGLNIVWSPDDGSRRGQIGHGGGKTTFCRLLRYCLGEDSFGPEVQRRAIFEAMPMGRVGAEVRLNGESWLIRRSFQPLKEDYALQGPSFAAVGEFPAEPTGMQPFRDAATQAFLADALPLIPASIGSDGAWQALLAWMTRDQECRFGHLLDWRSPDSGSRSPVSGRSRPQDDREAIVRIVLNALRIEEIETRRKWEAENAALGNQRTLAGRLSWRLAEWRSDLAQALGLNADNASGLDAAIVKAAAAEQLAKLQGLPSPVTLDQLRAVREAMENAVRDEGEARAAIALTSSKKDDQEVIAKIIADELPELSAQNQRLEYPVCPVCGVLIDKARAEGCGVSLQFCDLVSLRAKVNERIETRNAALAEAARLQSELPTLQHRLAAAGQTLAQRRNQLAALERAAFARSQVLRRAERNLDAAIEFERSAAQFEEAERAIEQHESRLKVLRGELDAHLSAVASLISDLSDRFNTIFHQMIPVDERCSVKLDGNGFGIKVPASGTAIVSLDVVLFDLAVLAMAIEGKTRHPSFLIHDSPREADLGSSIYAGLFDLAKKLEEFGPAPLFQYIVTTTTEPPEEFRAEPWLRDTLRGSPAEQRLLGKDL
jgi:hypothetical protein